MASLFISSKGEINSSLKSGPVYSLNFGKVMILIISFVAFFLVLVLLCKYFPMQCYHNLGMGR